MCILSVTEKIYCVLMTTYDAASDNKVGIITILGSNSLRSR